jgi:Outer membrane lipoprotein-sorting protein
MTINAIGWRAFMLFCARLVVLALLTFFPQYTSEIPLSLSWGIPLSAQQPGPVNGDWVARQVDGRDTGRDARSSMQMRLFDRQGRKRERTLTLLALEGAPAGAKAAAKGDAIGDRLLMRFTYPNDIAGTSFLVWERDGAEDERFLFLPALGRVRRIAGSERQESFVGSDFTYEDISGRDLSADSRALLRRETHEGVECFVIESTPKVDAGYARRLSWIDTGMFLPRKEEFYDRRNRLIKVFHSEVVQVVKGHPTILRRTMKDASANHATVVEMTGVDYDLGIEEDVFTERYLRRPPARWVSE